MGRPLAKCAELDHYVRCVSTVAWSEVATRANAVHRPTEERVVMREQTPADNYSIINSLLALLDSDYFGVITLAVQHGRIINIRKEQNLKPAEIVSLARN